MTSRDPLSALSAAALALLLPSCAAQSVYADITTPVSGQLGTYVDILGDIDADGHAEFTASTFSTVSVYSGRTGVQMTTFAGRSHGHRAGDIDGDGKPELLAKVQYSSNVQVLRGGTWTVLHTLTVPTAGSAGISAVAALGDADGDGVDDIGISTHGGVSHVFSGQSGLEIYTGSGGYIAAVGDVTGDGVADFATQTSTATTVHALVGPAVSFPPIGRVWNLPAGPSCCAGVGDVDGDTVPDFAISESYGTPGGLYRAGEIFVHSGATGALLRRIPGTAANTRLGRRLASFVDVNGDGVAEVLATTGAARADVLDLVTGVVATSITGVSNNEIDAGLDITGDGVADAILGAPQPGTNNPGFVRLVSGATLTLQADSIHLPAATGGTVQLTVDMGPSYAGAVYIVVGSLTDPVLGFSFGGVPIPVNRDFYFASLVGNPNTFISNSLGSLDASGRAQAVLTAAPGFIPNALASTVVRHCCVLLPGATPLDVTNPMPVTIL